ncbi:MAG: TolC family protein [Pseudomonadales bacterium]|nr:TolC family protein [Pseudomonadales bacterium]
MKNPLCFLPLLGLLLFVKTVPLYASELSLKQAEALALDYDVSVQRILSQAEAMGHLSIAESDFPDPVLKFGAQNIPVDSWALDEDPMTQAKISLSQRFTAGNSREDTAKLYQQQQLAKTEQAALARLQLIYNSRLLWLDAFKWQAKVAILKNDKKLFVQLKDLTYSLYEVGKRQQQDVLRSDLELGLLLQKQMQAEQTFSQSRLQMAVLTGPEVLTRSWPTTLSPLMPITVDVYNQTQLATKLSQHPQIRQLHYQLRQADAQIALVDSNTKTVWGAEVSYGYRGSENDMGEKRSDLVSAMVNVSIPLWGGNRNDKRREASRLQKQQLQYGYDDTLRQLYTQVQAQTVLWQQLQQRRKFYATDLISKADRHVHASLKAYETGVGDLQALMRASINRQQFKLDYLQLQIDEQKALAKLYLLLGESQAQEISL